MGILFAYILKSSFCLAFFYLFYRLLLSKETFHRFNRIALLSVLVLSWLLPLITFTANQPSQVSQAVFNIEQLLIVADMSDLNIDGQVDSSLSINIEELPAKQPLGIMMLLLIYVVGVLFFVCRHLYSMFKLGRLMRSSRKEIMADGVKLYVHNKSISPFSWMRCIVISQKDLEENGREILIHEKSHINHLHSWDLLLADISIYFQWFNPAAWLLKQELQSIHEYQADNSVLREGVDAKQYQLLLIKKAVGTRLYSMANSFNQSTLKKRITMMLKQKSSPWARLKYLYVLPLAAIAVTAFARPEISETMNEISNTKISDLVAINETSSPGISSTQSVDNTVTETVQQTSDDKVYDIAAVMPQFPGGPSALNKYIEDHIKQSAVNANGRVIVQFVVTKTGKITDAVVNRGVNPSIDAEAIRLVKSMPDFIPGKNKDGEAVNVKYTLPISFKATADNKTDKSSAQINKMLTIVDGKEVTDAEMAAINSDDIKSISVLKDQAAIDAYGEKGKNGVVLITLYGKGEKPVASTSEQSASKDVVYIVDGKRLSPSEVMKVASDREFAMVKTGGTVTAIAVNKSKQQVDKPNEDEKPLVIINGKVMSNKELESINPNDFKSVNVLKGQAAIDAYGDKATNGVVIVTLKTSSEKSDDQSSDNRNKKTIGEQVYAMCSKSAYDVKSRTYYFNQKEITNAQYSELATKPSSPNNIVALKFNDETKHLSVYISDYSNVDDMLNSLDDKGLF